jgi:hypothetical protein
MASLESTEIMVERASDSTNKVIGKEETGLTHECGVFGCIATGEWPTQIDVAQVICLGLVALQHRYCLLYMRYKGEVLCRIRKPCIPVNRSLSFCKYANVFYLSMTHMSNTVCICYREPTLHVSA